MLELQVVVCNYRKFPQKFLKKSLERNKKFLPLQPFRARPLRFEMQKGGLKIFFKKIFGKCLEVMKKFLPLQPASETESFIDIMKTSSKPTRFRRKSVRFL